jgi:hypothetical protein
VSSSPDPLADSAALASTRAILHRPPPRAPLARIRKRLLLREVNERIRDVSTDFCTQHDCEFLCECGDPDCREPVSLSLAESGEVRANPSYFLTASEHWGEPARTSSPVTTGSRSSVSAASGRPRKPSPPLASSRPKLGSRGRGA